MPRPHTVDMSYSMTKHGFIKEFYIIRILLNFSPCYMSWSPTFTKTIPELQYLDLGGLGDGGFKHPRRCVCAYI